MQTAPTPALSGLTKSGQRGTNSGHGDHPNIRRRVTSLRYGYIGVKLDEFLLQIACQYSWTLSVGTHLG